MRYVRYFMVMGLAAVVAGAALGGDAGRAQVIIVDDDGKRHARSFVTGGDDDDRGFLGVHVDHAEEGGARTAWGVASTSSTMYGAPNTDSDRADGVVTAPVPHAVRDATASHPRAASGLTRPKNSHDSPFLPGSTSSCALHPDDRVPSV